MAKILNVTDTRKMLRGVLEDVNEHGERYVIERQGRPLAAIISWDQYRILFLEADNGPGELAEPGIC